MSFSIFDQLDDPPDRFVEDRRLKAVEDELPVPAG
jgi:hypothetical protein